MRTDRERQDREPRKRTGGKPNNGQPTDPGGVTPADDSGYVPTGGANDPNTWKTDPQYGQVGANRGAGYNPEYWKDKGGYDAFKQSRRDWRARFQEGGDLYEKDRLIKASILGAHPGSEAELGQLLNSLGIFDKKEQGQSYYRKTMMDYGNNVWGNYHIDPETGRMINVATSDVNRNWENISPDARAELDRGFFGRLADELGVGRFNAWQQAGKGSAEGVTANGLYYNHGPNGIGYWDKEGYETDATGKRTGGHYMFDNAGGFGGNQVFGGPVGTGGGTLLKNNPAQKPGDLGYVAPPTGTNGVAASIAPTPNTAVPAGVNAASKNKSGGKVIQPSIAPSIAPKGTNPGGTSIPAGWGGGTTEPMQMSQNPAAPQAPSMQAGGIQTKTASTLKPLTPAPPSTQPAQNPNLLRLSMLGGRRPMVY